MDIARARTGAQIFRSFMGTSQGEILELAIRHLMASRT